MSRIFLVFVAIFTLTKATLLNASDKRKLTEDCLSYQNFPDEIILHIIKYVPFPSAKLDDLSSLSKISTELKDSVSLSMTSWKVRGWLNSKWRVAFYELCDNLVNTGNTKDWNSRFSNYIGSIEENKQRLLSFIENLPFESTEQVDFYGTKYLSKKASYNIDLSMGHCLLGLDLSEKNLLLRVDNLHNEDPESESAAYHITLNLSGADLRFSNFHKLKIDTFLQREVSAHIFVYLNDVNLRGADLQHCEMDSVEMNNTKFKMANLSNADFSRCQFKGADMEEAVMEHAKIYDCEFKEANMTNIKAAGLNFDECHFYHAYFFNEKGEKIIINDDSDEDPDGSEEE